MMMIIADCQARSSPSGGLLMRSNFHFFGPKLNFETGAGANHLLSFSFLKITPSNSKITPHVY